LPIEMPWHNLRRRKIMDIIMFDMIHHCGSLVLWTPEKLESLVRGLDSKSLSYTFYKLSQIIFWLNYFIEWFRLQEYYLHACLGVQFHANGTYAATSKYNCLVVVVLWIRSSWSAFFEDVSNSKVNLFYVTNFHPVMLRPQPFQSTNYVSNCMFHIMLQVQSYKNWHVITVVVLPVPRQIVALCRRVLEYM